MVEVIKRNEMKEQIMCCSCGSILEYSPSDAYIDKEYDHLLRYETHKHYILCPVCKKHIKVKERIYDRL